jgi:hypothetical protein
MDETQEKLADLDLFFEKVLVDFQHQLERIEEIKISLLDRWCQLKKLRYPQQINENLDNNKVNDLSELTAEFISMDKDKISYIDERCKKEKFDCCNLTNDANFNREKSFVKNTFRDTSINFSKVNPIKQTNQNLKRKSKIQTNFNF